MTTLKEIRSELVKLRDYLRDQKGGLTRQQTEVDKEWYKYAIERSDKAREDIKSIISMLDEIIG